MRQGSYILSCSVCSREIPLDAAFTPEGADYVVYFCGLECYQRFEARAKTRKSTNAEITGQRRKPPFPPASGVG